MLCWVFFSPNTSGPLFVYGNYSNNFVGMYIRGNALICQVTVA